MTSVTVIILTKNEEKNIQDSIESAKQIANRIIVVDSGSIDQTIVLAQKYGAEVYYHEWLGHAAQFNWALDNCDIKSDWVFRLDADERISQELAEEINSTLQEKESALIDGYEMRWRVFFMGKWIRHGGTHKPYFLRLFRYGKGRVEDKLMDEHIIVQGNVKKLKGELIHYDYKGSNAWLNKHIWYSELEIQMYNKLPMFLRARVYYWYRYYIQLGFLDGREGKIFIYLQAYWYRFIVDAKLYERDRK